MNLNYMFNVSVESFAKLTGRSLSVFKRDFEKYLIPPKNGSETNAGGSLLSDQT